MSTLNSRVEITPIPLTQGLVAWIDMADLQLITQHKWFAALCGKRWYAARTEDGRRVFMHRQLLRVPMVDHRDGDGLNNTRANLRPCTSTQNTANRVSRAGDSKTGLRGVFVAKGGFMARLRHEGTDHYLGLFTSASHAYANVAYVANRLQGEFSRYEVRAAND